MSNTLQYQFTVGPFRRGYHLITSDIVRNIGELPERGILHVFIRHTSAGLTINENADPDVRHDFALYFDRLVPENLAGMRHTLEGPDDMPAHIKASLVGASVSIPIANHKLALGTWQGIYLCEFRNHAGHRQILATIFS